MSLIEYCFEVPAGTTVAGINDTLLDAEFRKFRWLPDAMVLREECRLNVMLTNKDDFDDDTTLWLDLVFRWPDRKTYDD